MIDLKTKLNERLSHKKINSISIWYLCSSVIKKHLWNSVEIKSQIKNDILIIKVKPIFYWSEIFKSKEKIISDINNNFEKFWNKSKIKNIIIK